MASRPTRFERGLREIHGAALDFVEVQPRRWRPSPSRPTFRRWWATTSPFERFARLWWWGLCAVLGAGAGALIVAAFFA